MVGPETLLVLALAVFTAATLRLRRPARHGSASRPWRWVDVETLRGVVLIGAGGLGVLALAIVVVGFVGRPDQAAGLAVIGLFGYAAYLALMVPLSGWLSRR